MFTVTTSLGIARMQSRIASMPGTEPPGELINSRMSASGSSAASSSSPVQSRLLFQCSSGSPSSRVRRANNR